jgi:formylglycine-generating enzyme required for sulfatase activity
MHGNAFEWVQDCWHGDYHGAPSDGSAWMAGDRFTRYRDVVRGGDFDASPRFLRSAFRFAFPREKRQSFVGFRLAREVN